jgi:hypothetical protein
LDGNKYNFFIPPPPHARSPKEYNIVESCGRNLDGFVQFLSILAPASFDSVNASYTLSRFFVLLSKQKILNNQFKVTFFSNNFFSKLVQ